MLVLTVLYKNNKFFLTSTPLPLPGREYDDDEERKSCLKSPIKIAYVVVLGIVIHSGISGRFASGRFSVV